MSDPNKVTDELQAVRDRDAESAATWFTGPASFTAQGARDRRYMLAKYDETVREYSEIKMRLWRERDDALQKLRESTDYAEECRRQMDELAVMLLQNDRDGTMEWARGVKIDFTSKDGGPRVSIDPQSSHEIGNVCASCVDGHCVRPDECMRQPQERPAVGQRSEWTCDGCKGTFAAPVNGLCPECGCNLIDKAAHDPADPLYWKSPRGPQSENSQYSADEPPPELMVRRDGPSITTTELCPFCKKPGCPPDCMGHYP